MGKGNKSKRRAAQKRHVAAGDFLEEFWRQSLDAAEAHSRQSLDAARAAANEADKDPAFSLEKPAASRAPGKRGGGLARQGSKTGSQTGSFLVEFHCHSTCSDGSLSPAQVVRRAASRGVKVLALTDHDTMGGVAEATAAGREVGVCVIPGVEISAYYDCNMPRGGGRGAACEKAESNTFKAPGLDTSSAAISEADEKDRGGSGGLKEGRDGVEETGLRGEGVEAKGGPGVHILAYFPPLGMREQWQRARRKAGAEGDEGREGEEGEEVEDGEGGLGGEGKKPRVSYNGNGAETQEEGGIKDAHHERVGSEEVGQDGVRSKDAGDGFGRLVGVLEGIREGRHRRAAGMVQRLQQMGVSVTMADVIKQLDDPNTAPGRVHVARALVAVKAVGEMEEAFQKYIGDHGPAYVRGSEIPVAEAIRVIREAGGAAVLAHPWTIPESTLRGMLKRVVEDGLTGMEVYRGKEIQEEYCRLANAHGLLKIGGSDFHGPAKLAKKGAVDLGGCELPALAVQRFVEAAGRNWRA
ncbi:hypothetical protein CLOP_g22912 [Closterium sp. NIES-67]|nr:hypothetical protein CLOP_g22912 [Closterium sp. NIES-67]